MGAKKIDEAIAVLQRNVELYSESANVYDSLGEALEAARKYDLAGAKAIEMPTRSNDGALTSFQQHLERVTAEEKAGGVKSGRRNDR